ncbi:hypothetical protein ACPXB5_11370 [Micromonospora arida]|uniref:hypothetical protein n=1 Tax=Micromonospora arida TaxID=2203715 RepID=UPI003CF29BC1
MTSVLSMLPKGFLKFWAAKSVAEFAVANLGDLVGIVLRGGAQAAIDMLKRAPDRDTRAAADVGTEAHDLFEKLAKGEPIGRVHPELQPFVDHFREFLAEFSPEFVFLEETVWSESVDYAGSFDAFAVINGESVFIDWKTTRSGIHAEVAIQLAAYRHADYIIRPDGSKVPMPASDGGAVLHVRPEGWKLVPVRCDERVFDVFKHLREVFRWERELKDTVIGDPLAESSGATPARRRTPAPRRAA